MAKPKKTPRKKGSGRKQLPEHLRKTGIKIYLRNEQWQEILEQTTEERLAESFYQWFKEVKSSKYVEVKEVLQP